MPSAPTHLVCPKLVALCETLCKKVSVIAGPRGSLCEPQYHPSADVGCGVEITRPPENGFASSGWSWIREEARRGIDFDVFWGADSIGAEGISRREQHIMAIEERNTPRLIMSISCG